MSAIPAIDPDAPFIPKRKLLAIDPGPVESAFVVWDGLTHYSKIVNNAE